MTNQTPFEKDIIPTSAGDLEITFLGHGSLLMTFGGKTIYIDPFSRVADYTQLPKADLILITHEHRDHLDPQALAAVRTEQTSVVVNKAGVAELKGGIVMRNGEQRTVSGIPIEAVSAYNLVNQRPDGKPYHPKGTGNGYILTFGDQRIYIAGDTEDIPEMQALQSITCAFLPMNLPYTMTPEMVARAARIFRPKVLYPYHFGSTDTAQLQALLQGDQEIEVRIRQMA